MLGYRVVIDNSFNLADAGKRLEHGTFATMAQAIAEGRSLVEAALATLYRAGMSADELLEEYFVLGKDTLILPPPGGERVDFSAWDYAASRAAVLCRGAA